MDDITAYEDKNPGWISKQILISAVNDADKQKIIYVIKCGIIDLYGAGKKQI